MLDHVVGFSATHAYGHRLADVHSGGFAPAFTLSFHDSERSRKPPNAHSLSCYGQQQKNKKDMKKTFNLNGFLIIVLTIITSCSNDPIVMDGSYAIKSIVSNGAVTAKFIYNDNNKIVEDQSFYFCNKFIYDDNGRLIKQEIAVDPDIYSSTFHIKSDLMTSQNSTFTANRIFEYNAEGKLITQKYYIKKNDQFELTSMNSIEYVGDKMVKWNLHNDQNTITQFYTYEYDGKGNVIKEKQYSYLSAVGTEPKLVSEVSFKYDDKNNPFKIYKQLGHPALYTNTNNVIESNSVLYEDVPGINKFSTSKTTFEYNTKGYPIKVNNNEIYKYD